MINTLVVGTAGHIDHGKSTLVHALTGTDPDRLKEEKLRGITIDLGFAHTEISGRQFAFVDVPGHERFVRHMLAGAGGIDAVLLVVAADESVMPQTREHFEICRLLRVRSGLIVLTKADLADDETLELARIETREMVAGSFLADAPIIAVSARTGAGLSDLRAALVALGDREAGVRRAHGWPRLPIDRVFSMKGFGTVVTGTLVSGHLQIDDEVVVAPRGTLAKVRGLQVHGRPRSRVEAGHRLAVNLSGVDIDAVARGDSLLAPGTLRATRRVDAMVETLATARPLRHGARVRFHQGTAEVLGRVSLAGLRIGGAGQPEGAAAELPAGSEGYVRIRLERPAVLTRRDRFILRAYSPASTIAGGEILDPFPPRGGARSEAGRRRLARLDPSATTEEVAQVLVEESGPGGLARTALGARVGLSAGETGEVIKRLVGMGVVRDLGSVLVLHRTLDDLAGVVLAELEAHHKAQPLSEGVAREELRSRRFRRAHDAVFQAVLDRLLQEGTIAGRERLALSSHRVELTPEEASARRTIEEALRRAELKPLAPSELPAALGLSAALVDRMLRLLHRQKVIVKVDELWFHAEALARLKREVAALKSTGSAARVDVTAFKEAYGLSRKFAIPLLEYLDRERVTRRVGDARVIL